MIIGLICSKHGYQRGSHCPGCESLTPKDTLNIITYNWVKQGEWEHIDPWTPNMRFDSKEELIRECEKRDLYPKAFMKPKSRGQGYEIRRRIKR